jgi:glycosyltransferase involved in cell wall biosynthesis
LISLVCATVSRTSQLDAFLASLSNQSYRDFQVILVDQNHEDILAGLVARYSDRIDIEHIKTSQKGLSRARNLGIQHAAHDIIGFPDDDCIYPVNTLELVSSFFTEHPHIDFISGIVIDPDQHISPGNMISSGCPINKHNFMRTVMSAALFVRRRCVRNVRFCNELGAGTPYGSAEESEFAYNLIRYGFRGKYIPETIRIHHRFEQPSIEKEYQYALGLGAFLRKCYKKDRFLFTWYLIYYLFYRPFGGMLLNPSEFSRYAARLKGRSTGFITYNGG